MLAGVSVLCKLVFVVKHGKPWIILFFWSSAWQSRVEKCQRAMKSESDIEVLSWQYVTMTWWCWNAMLSSITNLSLPEVAGICLFARNQQCFICEGLVLLCTAHTACWTTLCIKDLSAYILHHYSAVALWSAGKIQLLCRCYMTVWLRLKWHWWTEA